MKIRLIISLLFGCSLLLAACVYPVGVGAGYFRTLPPGYSAPCYHQNNRYYYGGRYEPGRFDHQGQSYSGRYFHGGHYIYGGHHYDHPR